MSRVERLKKLLEVYNPYEIRKFERTVTAQDFKKKYSNLKAGEETDAVERFAGRIMRIRFHGGISFADAVDETGRLQLVFRRDLAKDAFKFLEDFVDEGDIIGVEGNAIRTRRGELSILVRDIKILSKCLRQLPHTWYGVTDPDTRFRQRYLDFIINPEARKGPLAYTAVVKTFRGVLDSLGFTEVFTPILQPIYGGALATPFETFHKFLNQKMYLRIAPELYLKRLVVGGFWKVYEIGPCFRNESIDAKHNPEFLQLEAYWALKDASTMMDLTEALVKAAINAVNGSNVIIVEDEEIKVPEKFERIPMRKAIEKIGKIKLPEAEEELRELARDMGIDEVLPGKIIEEIFSQTVEKKLKKPTFITDFPLDISPLAKRKSTDTADRFELYIAGMEIANGYSELNNPYEQYLRFKDQEELRRKVKKELEYMPMDRDYIRALEYALPPTGGLGIGIARVVMAVAGIKSIKEVIYFPTVRATEEIELVVEKTLKDLQKKLGV